ncbi:Molybdenum cofactor synthesis protein 3 [Balamuthia mandrillaris]
MQQAEDEEQSACSALTAEEAKRYGRQLLLPQFGVEGQKRLAESSVLLVGAGGLGSPIALYLAGAGVGCLGIVDDDTVELSNLHRQIIHSEQTVGQPKALSAQQAIQRLNSSITVIPYNTRLTSENALQLLESYDVVVDATDNIATRYLLNDSCVLSGKPLVSGSALGLEGRLTVYHYRGGPCYRCVWPRPPPPDSLGSCSENGVLGIVPGIIGSLQALEVIKVLTGMGEVLSQKMLLFSATNTQSRVIGLPPRNPKCVVCSNESPTTATMKLAPMEEYERFCGVSNDKNSTLSILPSEHHVSCVVCIHSFNRFFNAFFFNLFNFSFNRLITRNGGTLTISCWT